MLPTKIPSRISPRGVRRPCRGGKSNSGVSKPANAQNVKNDSGWMRANLNPGLLPDVRTICRSEFFADHYFHALQEAAKSVASKMRNRTASMEDGATLVDRVLSGGPLLLEPAFRLRPGACRLPMQWPDCHAFWPSNTPAKTLQQFVTYDRSTSCASAPFWLRDAHKPHPAAYDFVLPLVAAGIRFLQPPLPAEVLALPHGRVTDPKVRLQRGYPVPHL